MMQMNIDIPVSLGTELCQKIEVLRPVFVLRKEESVLRWTLATGKIDVLDATISTFNNILNAGNVTWPVTILGGNGNDTVTGGSASDSLCGGGGADSIFGQEGNDSLSGGAGNDRLNGGNNDDVLLGGGGRGPAAALRVRKAESMGFIFFSCARAHASSTCSARRCAPCGRAV